MMKLKIYERNGKKYTTADIIKTAGVVNSTARKRLKKWEEGKITEEILLKPYPYSKSYTHEGKEYTKKQVAEIAKINITTAKRRLEKWITGKMTEEEMLREKSKPKIKIKVKKEKSVQDYEQEVLDKIPGETETERKYREMGIL